MTLAVLVETLEGEARSQTLLFPHKGEVRIYHRLSTGQAGRGQTWSHLSDIEDLPDTLLSKKPVAVVLTERDTALVDTGLVTNIGAKALYAYESADPVTAPISHRDSVLDLKTRFESGDNSLSDLITDKRRNQGVILTPLSATPNVTFIKQSEPIKQEVTIGAHESTRLAYENMITVPDQKWSRDYINRYFEDGKSDFEIYDYADSNDINVLIEGGAGSGKTMSVIAYASARQKRYFNVSSNAGIDPSQLFGRWIPREDGHGYRWQDGAVDMVIAGRTAQLLS